MIDFRYHLVSLISVFLALAVGIVLGAGPLKDPIDNELRAQVEALRTEKDTLREELNDQTTQTTDRDGYLTAVGEELVTGLLPDRSVALVVVGDPGEDAVGQVADRLTEAGATLGARVDLGDKWWNTQDAPARQAAADALRPALVTLPDDADTPTVLATALVAALTGTTTETEGPPTLSAHATALGAALADHGLIGAADISAPADGLVLLTASEAPVQADQEGATPRPTATAEARDDLCLDLAGQAARTAAAVLLAGPADRPADPVLVVRSDRTLGSSVSTVDDAGKVTGQLSVPRALALGYQGVTGHWGTAPSARGSVDSGPLAPPHSPAPEPSWARTDIPTTGGTRPADPTATGEPPDGTRVTGSAEPTDRAGADDDGQATGQGTDGGQATGGATDRTQPTGSAGPGPGPSATPSGGKGAGAPATAGARS